MTRTALVTGASSGIGAATAEVLAERGYALLLVARRKERLEELAKRLADTHRVAVSSHVLDVRQRDQVEAWASREQGALAALDLLVNSAGLARGLGPVQAGDPDDWDEMIDTNVKGLLYVTRAVLPHLVRRAQGDVVNIGSVAGRWVYPQGAVYCGSKHAERAITEGLRMDLNGTGVRVSTVDPGLVETEFSTVRFRGDTERARNVYQGLRPLTARDVAETIAWIVERPRHINVAEIVLYPSDQASPTLVSRKPVPGDAQRSKSG